MVRMILLGNGGEEQREGLLVGAIDMVACGQSLQLAQTSENPIFELDN